MGFPSARPSFWRASAGIVEEVPPHRRAGDHHPFRMGIVLPGVLKAHHDPVHHLGEHLGGEAGNCVGLVDGGGDTPPRRLLDHGIGGVAAGAHHQVGPEFIQNGPGLPPRLGQRNHGHDIVLDVLPFPGPVDGVHVDGAQLIALMGHQRPLHPVVRSGEENLAALMPELEEPGQRDGRIDMPRGTAAGKEYLQGNTFSNRPWGPGFVLTRSARCPSPAAGSAGPCPRN